MFVSSNLSVSEGFVDCKCWSGSEDHLRQRYRNVGSIWTSCHAECSSYQWNHCSTRKEADFGRVWSVKPWWMVFSKLLPQLRFFLGSWVSEARFCLVCPKVLLFVWSVLNLLLGTRVGKLVMGKYGLYSPSQRRRTEEFLVGCLSSFKLQSTSFLFVFRLVLKQVRRARKPPRCMLVGRLLPEFCLTVASWSEFGIWLPWLEAARYGRSKYALMLLTVDDFDISRTSSGQVPFRRLVFTS